MSRIREHLKKAAEDRRGQIEGRSTEDFVELLEQGREEPRVVKTDSHVADNISTDDIPPGIDGGTEFARLVVKCTQAHWQVHPRFSVFLNEEDHKAGAERFRT